MKRQREEAVTAKKEPEVVTISDSDDEVEVVRPVKVDRREQASDELPEVARVEDDVSDEVADPHPPVPAANHTNYDEEEEDGMEGMPLGNMGNVILNRSKWGGDELEGRFVVQLGGDESCFENGKRMNCSRVAHFKATHHEGINGNVFYLSGIQKEGEQMAFPEYQEGNPWPCWHKLNKHFVFEGDVIGPVIAVQLLADKREPKRLEKLLIQQIQWIKEGEKWVATKKSGEIDILSEIVYIDPMYSTLTNDKYSLSSVMCLNKKHDSI